MVSFEKIEEGIDVSLDSFEIFLPSESSYQDPNALCDELIMNGNAQDNGFNPYPMKPVYGHHRIQIIEEGGNKFWRLINRQNEKASLVAPLDVNCLTRGVTYMLSARVRYRLSEGFVGGSEPYYWYIHYQRASDNSWRDQHIVDCDPQSAADGWVTCSGEVIIDEAISTANEASLRMGLHNWRDGGKYDIDYDDISFKYYQGYVNELVVDSGDTSCWGSDSDIHVTSATNYNNDDRNGGYSQIQSHAENGDGTTNIQLREALTLPIITVEENVDEAVEIALISRNVRVQGDDDEDNKGGYMQVLHTPDVAQLIQGIEFVNMGRMGEVDRFVSDLFFANEFLFSIPFIFTKLRLSSFSHYNCSILATWKVH